MSQSTAIIARGNTSGKIYLYQRDKRLVDREWTDTILLRYKISGPGNLYLNLGMNTYPKITEHPLRNRNKGSSEYFEPLRRIVNRRDLGESQQCTPPTLYGI